MMDIYDIEDLDKLIEQIDTKQYNDTLDKDENEHITNFNDFVALEY